MKAKELEQMILEAGWYLDRQGKGSHQIYKHPEIKGIIVIPFHGALDIPTGTAHSILKKAGIKGK